MTTDEDTLVLKRSLRRQIAVLLWWGIVGLGVGSISLLIGIGNVWDIHPWLYMGRDDSKSLSDAWMGFAIGLFMSFVSILAIVSSFTRRLIIDHEGITDISLLTPFRPATRKLTLWSNVCFVKVDRSLKCEIPWQVDLDDGKSINLASDGFGRLELAMPLIRRYVPEENIDHLVDWEPSSTLVEHDAVVLKPTRKTILLEIARLISWSGLWLWVILNAVALQRFSYLARRLHASESDLGPLAHFNPLPIYLFATFWIIVMAIAVLQSLTLRYVICSEGIVYIRRSVLFYKKHRKLCGWKHVHCIYTTSDNGELVPTEIIIDGGRMFRDLERFSDLNKAMDVIRRHSPVKTIFNWDLLADGHEFNEGQEAQSENEADSTTERIILQGPKPVVIAVGLIGSLAVFAGAAWVSLYMSSPALRAAFPVFDKCITTLVIMSCVSLFTAFLPIPVMVLRDVIRAYRRLGTSCVIDQNGFTFNYQKRKRPEVREQIAWEHVQQVFIYKTISGLLPVEILLHDGRCVHLHRLFPSSHCATPLILCHVPPDAVKDWPFSCSPPGCKDPRKRR